MSKRSRARKQERIFTISAPEQEPETITIDAKKPACAVVIALPDTPARIRARAALTAATKELEALTEQQRERALKEFDLFEGCYDEEEGVIMLPTGLEIGYTKNHLKNPKEFYRALIMCLLSYIDDEEEE